MDNSILSNLRPTGKKVGGVNASFAEAKADLKAITSILPTLKVVAIQFGLPWAVLAGIASRESGVGRMLDKNGMGDSGHAFGIFQVDVRENMHVAGKPDPFSQAHIEQAAQKLSDFLRIIKCRHPSWTPWQQLQGCVASYNYGPGNCQSVAGIDVGTTSGDYSNDSLARSVYFASQLK